MKFTTSEWIKTQFENFASRVNEVFATKQEVDEKISGTQIQALVFDTKNDLEIWMEDETNKSTLKVGQNIYIKAVDTPDYWWDGTELQFLETEKVNLDGYVTETELDTKLSAYVKDTDIETDDIDFSGYFTSEGL